MAKFCTSCGSPVDEALKFCPKCGTQLGVASGAGPTRPSQAPAAPGPVTGGAVAAAVPAKKGSPVVKIILIVVALFVVIGVLGAAAGIYFVYKAKQKVTSMVETAKTTSMRTGTPEIRVEKGGGGSEAAAAATVDVPPYPNATPTESGGDFSFGGKGGISGQEYETSDSVEQVLAFYKDKLGSKIHIQQSNGTAMFTLATQNGLTTVTISREAAAEKTKIHIARFGK